MDNLILADFKTKTWHKPKTVEEQASMIAAEMGALIGQEVAYEMIPYHDTAPSEYVAPSDDCA